MNDIVTSPYEKWNAINDANKFVRRVALTAKPSLITAIETQNTVAGTSEYTLTKIPQKMTGVRMNGRPIASIDVQSIPDLTKTGTPTHYYTTAFRQDLILSNPCVNYAFPSMDD